MRKKNILVIGCISTCVCVIILFVCLVGDVVKVNKVTNDLSTKIYFKGNIGELKSNDLNQIFDFLSSSEKLGENINAKEEFILKNREVDSIGFTHYKLQQVVNSIPVYNGELIVHVKENKTVYLINGNYHENAKKVKINIEDLLEKSELETKAMEAIESCNKKKAKIGEQLIYSVNGEYTVAYEIKVYCILSTDKIYKVFIDGYTGEVYDYYNIIKSQ